MANQECSREYLRIPSPLPGVCTNSHARETPRRSTGPWLGPRTPIDRRLGSTSAAPFPCRMLSSAHRIERYKLCGCHRMRHRTRLARSSVPSTAPIGSVNTCAIRFRPLVPPSALPDEELERQDCQGGVSDRANYSTYSDCETLGTRTLIIRICGGLYQTPDSICCQADGSGQNCLLPQWLMADHNQRPRGIRQCSIRP